MAVASSLIDHLLRRAGFGATPAERALFDELDYESAVDSLVLYNWERVGRGEPRTPVVTDIDALIGTPGYVGITARGAFAPNTIIADARQRWLFRMVHSPAPLQEKMTLFWHHHFATAYSKIAGAFGGAEGTREMAAKSSEDPARVRGQIEMLRDNAVGNFRDMLIEIARDPAMLVWLDGRTNTRTRPQENFGRELMELFTFGVEHYVEADVYAAARVFTGWNMTLLGVRDTPTAYYAFAYNQNQHDTNAKDFTFPIYADGSKRIPARTAAAGQQDGIDLINALAFHPETARRLARKLWAFFVSETAAPDPAFVEQIATVYLQSGTEMRPVIRAVLMSPQFQDPRNFFQRYAWPVEYVVRMLREVGHLGFSVNDALTPLLNMGQQLFEPPDVNGWDLGPGWFSTAGMLARMNFASQLATNQRFALRDLGRLHKSSPQELVGFAINQLSMPVPDAPVYNALLDYVRAGGVWSGTETQLLNKSGGVFHLLAGSGEYQFV